MPDHAARHDEAELVDRIGGVRHEDHVAGRGDGLRHVGEAFLGAQGRHDLRLRIELHAEAALVILGLGPAQAADAFGGGIAVGAWIAHRLHQFLDNMLRRRHVRIAHAEIDDVLAAGTRAGLQLVDLLEDIRRQPLNSMKVVVHGRSSPPDRTRFQGSPPLNHRNGLPGKRLTS